MSKTYGHFDEKNREYVITDPMTPEPWINYLEGNGKLNAFISNGAGGTAWYDQPHTGRLTRYRLNGVPMDTPGFYLYIRDGSMVWNPSYFPTMTPLDTWACHHGMGYTRFVAARQSLEASVTYFIPIDDEILLWDVTLRNTGTESRDIELFPYIDYSLLEYFKDTAAFQVCGNQARYTYDATSGGLLSDYFAFEAPFMGKTLFSATERFKDFDMDRNRFLGRGRTEANPIGLEQELRNTEIRHGGFYACGTFRLPFRLAPGETRRVVIKLAVGHAVEDVRALSAKYAAPAAVDAAAAALNGWWNATLAKCQVETPDRGANRLLNAWLPKNARSTMRNGRSISHRHAGTGTALRFRDTMQDLMPGTLFYPREVRESILLLMRSVTASGRVVTSLDPATLTCPTPAHTRSDAIVWGVFTLYKYLAETGDTAILDEPVPYYDGGSGSVLEHLVRGMRFTGQSTGRHGLPNLHDCDWNDMLQVFSNAKSGGESIMLAEQYIHAAHLLDDMLACADADPETRAFFKQVRQAFAERLASEVCWDGAWYKRLLYPDAELGGHANREGQIFLNAQSWAAMAGVLPFEQTRRAMDQVAERLDTDCGIRLFTPPFTVMMDGTTRFHTNTPGAGENGGLFLHANTWAVIAETCLRNPRRAWKYFSQILPSSLSARDPVHYGREPYAFASWVYGPDHEAYGHAALTWLTGGAAWEYIAGTEYILGIRPTLAGLVIDPCIPPEWDGFTVTRQVRGATYHIAVTNPEHLGCGQVRVTADGKVLPRNIVPYADAGATVKVEASIGS